MAQGYAAGWEARRLERDPQDSPDGTLSVPCLLEPARKCDAGRPSSPLPQRENQHSGKRALFSLQAVKTAPHWPASQSLRDLSALTGVEFLAQF